MAMDALTMMQGAGQGGVIASNAGYSGTPLWKLKQQRALPRLDERAEEAEAQAQAQAEEDEAVDTLKVAIDAVSLGRTDGAGEKPLVRHVIVKDLRKVAARSKVSLPAGGLFEGRVQVMLFALFDGQSCAEAPGPFAAEWCSKSLLNKLLRNLSALPPGYENATFVKATLKKTFEDLDKDILTGQPGIHDGCGAAVALTIGEKLFTAVVGKCSAIVLEAPAGHKSSQVTYVATNMGANQGEAHLPEEQKFLQENGGAIFQAADGSHCVSSPTGGVAYVTRSLGDRMWKGPVGGIPSSVKLLRGQPETRHIDLSWAEKHQCVLLVSAPINRAVSAAEAAKLAATFPNKARATAGELAAKASEACSAGSQCTAVAIYFLPKEDKAQPPAAKKAKKEAESVRLRHIVVKYKDCVQTIDPVRNRPATRSREDAEAILRRALRELHEEAATIKLPADANKAKLAALQPTAKYASLCRELSECTTAQKGGGMLGDLGWMSPIELSRYGTSFVETARILGVGQWSDLTLSEHGIHILQRIA
jgi:serine/threonine protein phosphatase PrpC